MMRCAAVMILLVLLSACGGSTSDPDEQENARAKQTPNAPTGSQSPTTQQPTKVVKPTAQARRTTLKEKIRQRFGKRQPAAPKRTKGPRIARSNKPVDRTTPRSMMTIHGSGKGGPIAVLTSRFKKEGSALVLRVKGRSTLPSGGLIEASLRYRGTVIPSFRGRGRIQDGRYQILLGPAKGHLLSGTYELMLQMTPERQPAAYAPRLRKWSGDKPPVTIRLLRPLLVRQATLKDTEKRWVTGHYLKVGDEGRALFEGLLMVIKQTDKKVVFRSDGEFDYRAFRKWRNRWQARVRKLNSRQTKFVRGLISSAHARLDGRITVMCHNLTELAATRSDQLIERHAPDRSRKRRGRGGDEEFITPADRERSIRQTLHEIAQALDPSRDERVFLKQMIDQLERLLKGPAYPEGVSARDAVISAHQQWRATLDGLGAEQVFSGKYDALTHRFELTRRALRTFGAAGLRQRCKTGGWPMPKAAAIKGEVPTAESIAADLKTVRSMFDQGR